MLGSSLAACLFLALALVHGPPTVRGTEVDYAKDVKFYLFTKNVTYGQQVQVNVTSFMEAGWRRNNKTKIIIHGYNRNITDPLFHDTAGAYLDMGFEGNLLGVDWSKLACLNYIKARFSVEGVGERVATVVHWLIENNMTKIEDLHMIGHSLGAHVCGNCGKKLLSSWKLEVPRITGLDPAMPLFLVYDTDRLARKDATLVDAIHTCGGYMGIIVRLGDYDFYVNGGRPLQPGCTVYHELIGPSCSHQRSHKLMSEVIRNSTAFESVWCETEHAAHWGKCYSNTTVHMGQLADYTSDNRGPYYLRTRSSSPFSF